MKTLLRLAHLAFLLFPVTAACGGATNTAHEPPPVVDGGAGDTDAGTSAFHATSADTIEITSSGGMPGPCPGGGVFSPATTFEIDLAALSATVDTSHACPPGDGGPAPITTRTVALNTLQRDDLVTAVNALTLRASTECGADAPESRVSVTHGGAKTGWSVDEPGTCHRGETVIALAGFTALQKKVDDLFP